MKNNFPPLPQKISGVSIQALILPILITMLTFLGLLVIFNPSSEQTPALPKYAIILIILWGITSVSLIYLSLRWPNGKTRIFKWTITILNGAGLGMVVSILPETFNSIIYPLLIIIVLLTTIVFGRLPAYFVIVVPTICHIYAHWSSQNTIFEIASLVSLPILSVAVAETMVRMQALKSHQISRLETINEFSKQVSASLDIEQLLPLLNDAIKSAIAADTYYVGILDGDQIKLDLFYDEGEYFYDIMVPIAGTISGWIVRNNNPLFLPDLRKPLNLEGVSNVIIGKEKTSLAWMGVPLYIETVLGVMAIASYKPNAFDRSDMELLENLAQQAALVLHNAIHHTAVEEQSKLDSLTKVYNHGYFLKMLEENVQNALKDGNPLSLIMLDVDYFKQYNDTYGHLAGDEILIRLAQAIRSHIKSSDSVGRWGGEEFAICLPNTTGELARQVALRVQETMRELHIQIQSKDVPSPTVSQGIAVLPLEAAEIIDLVHLADQRLYRAKERGRNQIEPGPSHWKSSEDN